MRGLRIVSLAISAAARVAAIGVAAVAVEDLAAGEVFVEVTEARGIDFRTVNGARDEKYLVETMVGGAGWLDHDGDGDLDLYLVRGHARPERALEDAAGDVGNVLYRNDRAADGTRRFVDVTAEAGVGDRGYGMGVATGDYDADGHVDLYVTNYGADRLFRNRGNGSFEDVTRKAGIDARGWSTSATFADLDGDGLLDLYVTRYLLYDTRRDGGCPARVRDREEAILSYCHPRRFEGASDLLYRNRGDGSFEDVSRRSGIGKPQGWLVAKGLGVVSSDFDHDGDVDVLVANDSVPNTLWRNEGGLRFTDVALEFGFAHNGSGAPEACMGLVRGDIDADGRLDYIVTNYSRETNTLYRNLGHFFEDATVVCRLARPSYLPLGFGVAFLDGDLDGDLDLYVANGHVLDNVEELHPGEGILYGQRDAWFENDGEGRFTDASRDAGRWFTQRRVGRGVARGDYDNDGDQDLVVTHVDGVAVLLENRAGDGKKWVGLAFQTASGGRTWYNTRVIVERDGKRTVHEIQTDGGYLTANDPRCVVAAGDAESIRVLWPGDDEAVRCPTLQPGKYTVLRVGSRARR